MQAGTHCHFNLLGRIKTLRLFLLLSSVLLTACGGGGPGSDGDTSDTGNTDINTTVTDGSSPLSEGTTPANVAAGTINYTLSGLSATTIYNVWIHDLSADVALTTYLDSGYQFSSCSSNNAGNEIEECSTVTSAEGKLFLSVTSAASTSYSITVKPVPANQGSTATPVSLSPSSSVTGQVGVGTSYYKVSGLTPGLVYDISMTNILAEADLEVTLQHDFMGVECQSQNTGSQDESCQLPANFLGELYIKATSPSAGAYYALTVTATAQTENIFEGFSDAPVDVTGQLPYNGTVNYDSSYYMFTGLTSGVRYEVRITNNTVNTQVYFYDTLEVVGVDCDLNYGFDVIAERLCVATAPASGNLYLSIPYYGTPGGTYTVDIGLAPVAEGDSITPKSIPATSMPYDGQVDTTYSYYVITGLIPDYVYELQFNDQTHQYAKMAVGDSLSTFNLGCGPCTLRSNINGEIYVKVDGTSTDNENNDLGAWFTLAFGNPEHAEGSVAEPVVIPGDGSKYAGEVDDRTSYYSATGLVAGQLYQVYLTTDEFSSPGVYSYTDNTYTTNKCQWLPGICLTSADAGGNLHIAVHGPDIYGASYDLWIQPSPYALEGSAGTPVDITAGLVTLGTPAVHQGKVSIFNTDSTEGTSYYVLKDLPLSTNYSIVASDLSDDVRLEVYSDAGFTTKLCTSSRRGTISEQCDVQTGAGGGSIKSLSLYIKVLYEEIFHSDQWDGASFTITASEGGNPLVSEGAINTPVDITGLLPYSGAVRQSEVSYYQLTGLTPLTDYGVKLNHQMAGLTIRGYTDASFSTVSCSNGTARDFTQMMGCNSTASGELFIRIDGGYRTDADYTIELVPIAVTEGSDVAPVDITGQLPYSGQANDALGLRSHYVVSGLTPSAEYLVVTRNGTRNTYTTAQGDSYCFNNGVPPSESCKVQVSASGELLIAVDGVDEYGAYFELDLKPAPPAEGSIASPVSITAGQVYSGQADFSGSYYVVSGLVPYSGHHISLQTQDDSHWLQIFTDANFDHGLCDNSNEEYGTGCGATADANGEIYFKISNNAGYYDIFVK